MTQILPRFYRSQQARLDRRAVDKAVAESIPLETQQVARSTPYGDRRRLRGIPVAGGACGTSPGTDPLAAVLRSVR